MKYQKAVNHGNTDASARLAALMKSSATLTRAQHENLAEETLGRRRTLVRMRSNATGRRSSTFGPAERSSIQQQVQIAASTVPEHTFPSGSSMASTGSMEKLNRYTLSDEPLLEEPPAKHPSNGSAPGSPVVPRPRKGPATFAEMV